MWYLCIDRKDKKTIKRILEFSTQEKADKVGKYIMVQVKDKYSELLRMKDTSAIVYSDGEVKKATETQRKAHLKKIEVVVVDRKKQARLDLLNILGLTENDLKKIKKL